MPVACRLSCNIDVNPFLTCNLCAQLELEDLYWSGQFSRLWAVASQTDLTFNLVRSQQRSSLYWQSIVASLVRAAGELVALYTVIYTTCTQRVLQNVIVKGTSRVLHVQRHTL